MRTLNYFLIVAYILLFVVESVIAGRWAPRIAYADTWVTGLLALVFFALLFVSLKNLKSVVGKIGLAVAIVTTIIQLGADIYFNSSSV